MGFGSKATLAEEPTGTFEPDEPPAAPDEDVPEPDDGDESAAQAADDTTAPMSKEDRQKALTAVYTDATRKLREAHTEEFNGYRVAGAAALGITWNPPPTAKQKAAAEIARLLAEQPELAQELALAEKVDGSDSA